MKPTEREQRILNRLGWTWKQVDNELLAEHFGTHGERDFKVWFEPDGLMDAVNIVWNEQMDEGLRILVEIAHDAELSPQIALSQLAGYRAFDRLVDALDHF